MMPTAQNNSLPLPEAAAPSSVASATAAAIKGIARGELGYQLTQEALTESGAATVFPLIALSGEAIADGLSTYMAEQSLADDANKRVKALVAQFERP